MAEAIVLRGGTGGVDCESATARANHVLLGYTFGTSTSEELVTGSMANNGAINGSITSPTGGTFGIAQGYHNGSGTVTGATIQSVSAYTIVPSTSNQTISAGRWYTGNVTIQGDNNFVASNIRQNVTIFNVTGTAVDYAASQVVWSL